MTAVGSLTSFRNLCGKVQLTAVCASTGLQALQAELQCAERVQGLEAVCRLTGIINT